MLLARRFTLNPVLVIMALIFWYWMWGVPGAILAVPMLAITKIICDQIQMLAAFGHFLEGWAEKGHRACSTAADAVIPRTNGRPWKGLPQPAQVVSSLVALAVAMVVLFTPAGRFALI